MPEGLSPDNSMFDTPPPVEPPASVEPPPSPEARIPTSPDNPTDLTVSYLNTLLTELVQPDSDKSVVYHSLKATLESQADWLNGEFSLFVAVPSLPLATTRLGKAIAEVVAEKTGQLEHEHKNRTIQRFVSEQLTNAAEATEHYFRAHPDRSAHPYLPENRNVRILQDGNIANAVFQAKLFLDTNRILHLTLVNETNAHAAAITTQRADKQAEFTQTSPEHLSTFRTEETSDKHHAGGVGNSLITAEGAALRYEEITNPEGEVIAIKTIAEKDLHAADNPETNQSAPNFQLNPDTAALLASLR